MQTLGVIDIGSNSVRLVLATIDERGFFKILDEVKESVRLGMDTGPGGELSEERMDRAMEVFRVFSSLCSAVKADKVISVATAAVRSAPNRDVFLKRALDEAGLHIRVISGDEEAFYDYFGTVNSMDMSSGLIIDIGGCSTELIHVEDRKNMNSISLPFGSISLTDRFSLRNNLGDSRLVELSQFFKEEFDNVTWLKKVKALKIIGIGGTFRNIGKIHRKMNGYPLDVSHNYSMDAEEMNGLLSFIESSDLKKRRSMKGLSKERADIILGATLLIDAIADYCEADGLVISGCGLREGVSYEHVLGKRDVLMTDVLEYELMSILRRYNLRENHAIHIWKLARSIFDQLEPVHRIGGDVSKIIKTASILHDVGVSVSYYDHHRHSMYIILNSLIKGLSHKEVVMSAFVAALHRKDDVNIAKSEFSSMLQKDDIATIRKLGLILRLAECLDRRLDGTIRDVKLHVSKDEVRLRMITDTDYTGLEEAGLRLVQPLFRKVLGKELVII
jgi:exopolyphosphatase / guanosine-5'-triphosphate,3'-diphosphate pyrophosphatase